MPTPSNDLNISQAGYVAFDGTATFYGRTLEAGEGITITNGNGVSGNTTISSTASLTDLHTARYIVSSSGTSNTGANYTTISSAIAAAQIVGVNATIFIQPGTYTENLTLPANINLVAYAADAFTPNVTIVGNITCSDAGTRTISGIRLQTNGAAFLTVSGNVATVVYIDNCYLNCANATGISFSSSSASARINISNCRGNLGTTGIGLFASSSAGNLSILYSDIENSGNSTTASTISAGYLYIRFSTFVLTITTSGTAGIQCFDCNFAVNFNATSLTHGGSGANSAVAKCNFSGGTSSALSIGGGATLRVERCSISSSNANAIDGTGSISLDSTTFTGISSTINSSLTITRYISSGISFDGTNNLANYATGTWTPGVSFGGGVTGLTYSTQQGYYTRIGNCVFVNFRIILSNKGSSTGAALLTGLPITTGANSPYAIPISLCAALTIAATTTCVSAYTNGAATTANLYYSNYNGGAVSQLSDTHFANTTQIYGSGVYIVA